MSQVATSPHQTLRKTSTFASGNALTCPDAQFTLDHASDAAMVPVVRKRKPSRPKPIKPPNRVLSTPSLPGSAMSDAEADKKRNKLGYQRTSVACSHCRRRKIRCIVSDDNRENKCENCIKLNKECNFYPVEQQGTMEAKSEASSRRGVPSAPSSAVSSSPSQIGMRGPVDMQGAFRYGAFPDIHPSLPTGYSGIPIAPAGPHSAQGPTAPVGYGFTSQPEATSPWTQGQEFHQGLAVSRPHHPQTGFVGFENPGIGAEFAPVSGGYPHAAPQGAQQQQMDHYGYLPDRGSSSSWQQQHQQHHHHHPHQQHQQQQQPVRSMSYPDFSSPGPYNPSFPVTQPPPTAFAPISPHLGHSPGQPVYYSPAQQDSVGGAGMPHGLLMSAPSQAWYSSASPFAPNPAATGQPPPYPTGPVDPRNYAVRPPDSG